MKIRLFFSILLLLVSAPLFAQEDEFRIAVTFSSENSSISYVPNAYNSAQRVSLNFTSFSPHVYFRANDFTRKEALEKLREIQRTIQIESKKGKKVTLFFYYAGHGGATQGGQDFFVLRDDEASIDFSAQPSLLYVWELESYFTEADNTLLFIDKCRTIVTDTLAYESEAYQNVQRLQASQKRLRMYSTQMDELASSGWYGTVRSPFATAINDFLSDDVSSFFGTKRTLEVLCNATLYLEGGDQLPTYTSNLPEDFFSQRLQELDSVSLTQEEVELGFSSGYGVSVKSEVLPRLSRKKAERFLAEKSDVFKEYKSKQKYFPALGALAEKGEPLAQYLAGIQFRDTTLDLKMRKHLFSHLEKLVRDYDKGKFYSFFQSLAVFDMALTHLEHTPFTPNDTTKAIEMLRESCMMLGFTYSCYAVGIIYEAIGEYDNAVIGYNMGRLKNIPDAPYRLALLYEAGLPTKKVSKKEINELLKDAAMLGSVDAMYKLGVDFRWCRSSKEEKAMAYELLELASSLGDDDAFAQLSTFYRDGVYVEQDIKRAYDMLLPLANKGNLEAIYQMGELSILYPEEVSHFCTLAVARHCTAKDWLEEGAEQGHTGCMDALIEAVYNDGKNDERALYWAKKLTKVGGEAYKNEVKSVRKLTKRITRKSHEKTYPLPSKKH